jgi:SAM-dependent methyltransferase
MDASFWDSRYAEDGLAYGEGPNDFLVESCKQLKIPSNSGNRALCIAEGEGRNAIYLGQQGYDVSAVDMSTVGMQKLNARAHALGLPNIGTEVADLKDYDFSKAAPEGWDLIISIYAHTPPDLRAAIHNNVKASLKSGGYFILEGYHPNNVGRGTGGPQVPPLCYLKADLLNELSGLEIIHAEELEREVNEGKYHSGKSAVVQIIARKP